MSAAPTSGQRAGKGAVGAVANGAMSGAASARVQEPLLSAVLRPVVYVATVAALCAPLMTAGVTLWTAAGAGLGAVLGRVVAMGALRTLAIFGFALAGVLLMAGVRGALLGSGGFAAVFGPAGAVTVANIVGVGGAVAVGSAGLRALCLRRRAYRVFEVLAVGVAFAQLVVSHRFGAINRPFELADSIIASGGDPTLALLGVGAVGAAFVAVLLLGERNLWRGLLHLSVAVGLLLLVLVTTQSGALPRPPQPDAMGLRKQSESDEEARKRRERERERQRQQGGGQGRPRVENEDLKFEDIDNSQQRQVPVAVVLLHDDYSPPNGNYYLRQSAFSQYNGKKLVQAMRADVDADIAPRFAGEEMKVGEAPNREGERVEVETTVALIDDHVRPFAIETVETLRPWGNPNPGRFKRVYRATSSAINVGTLDLLGRQVGDPMWDGEQLEHYLKAPADERYGELAKEIAKEVPDVFGNDPIAKAAVVTSWLGREGIYSLASGHAGSEDPTADFLFGDKTGYCVHFAHAATYLMRELGIPARVASGYVYEESSRQGGSAILLTGANSHAWAEFYVDGVGWVVADVQPQRTLDPPLAAADPDLQRLLGEMARGLDPIPAGEDRPLDSAFATLRQLGKWMKAAVVFGLPLLLLLAYVVKLWRRWAAPRLASDAAFARLAYRAQLDRLSEVQRVRAFGESPEGFALRLEGEAPSFAGLTAAHVGAAFGSRRVAARAEVQRMAGAARREMAQAVSLGRRLMGWLRPLSWLRSR